MTVQMFGQALLFIAAYAQAIYWTFWLASRGWRDGRGKIRNDHEVNINIKDKEKIM